MPNKIIKAFCYSLVVFLLFISCKAKKNYKDSFEKPKSKLASKYAEILEVEKEDIKNGKLYEFIDEWLGTPYKYGGLDKNGIDCSGFAYHLYKQVYQIQIPRNTSNLVNAIKRKYENELKEGDFVFFDYDKKKFSHVGIYLQNGYYIHASTKKGVMIMKLKDPYTYKYFSRCGSINLN